MPEVVGAEGRALGRDLAHHDPTLERLHPEESAGIPVGQCAVVVDHEGVREARDAVVGHGREVSEGVGIRQRSVLLEPLLQVGSLLVVEAPRVAAVVAREEASAVVDLATEGVAPTLREHLIDPAFGMVAPEVLALRIQGLGIRRLPVGPVDPHIAGHRATLGSIQPSVGAPAQRVGHAVGILEPEAREPHLRVAVRDIVAIGIAVEEQVGRVQYPHAAATPFDGGHDVEPVDEHRMPIEASVAIGVFMDADAVLARKVMGRRWWYLVVHRAPHAVAADAREARGRGVLSVLHHPHPTAFVEVEEHRLGDLRLGQHGFPFEIVGHLESRHRGLGAECSGGRLLRQVRRGNRGRNRGGLWHGLGLCRRRA